MAIAAQIFPKNDQLISEATSEQLQLILYNLVWAIVSLADDAKICFNLILTAYCTRQ